MRKPTHLCLITGMALAVFAGPSNAGEIRGEPEASFAPICAAREVQVITLLEDHARVLDIAADTLSEAGFARLEAQAACYEGRVGDAVAMYDRVIDQLSPLVLRAAR